MKIDRYKAYFIKCKVRIVRTLMVKDYFTNWEK